MNFLTKLILVLLGAGVLLVLSITIINARSTTPAQIISPLANTQVNADEGIDTYLSPGLKIVIDQALEGTTGTYAIYFEDLKTGETFTHLENRLFQTASLYKLWSMATAYQLIQEGKLDENEPLKKDASELNKIFNIASESAEIKEGEVAMTVKEAIEKSITISHNYAALLLSSRVRIARMKQFLKDHAFAHSKVGQPPVTNATDIATFYEKLYKGELVSKEYSQKMIDILKRQQLNDRLPKYLPKNTEVAHKTGEIDSFKHDAGIIFTPQRDYILVVLSESKDPKAAAERIARVSEAVYIYLKTQN